MGCDIHLVVERRIRRDQLPDKWVAVRVMLHGFETAKGQGTGNQDYAWPSCVERNYERFAALAGVRGEGPKARGLPEDASDTARLLFELDGGHTPSWLPLTDAAIIFVGTDHYELSALARDHPEYYYFNIEPATDGPAADHRVVFWFDS